MLKREVRPAQLTPISFGVVVVSFAALCMGFMSVGLVEVLDKYDPYVPEPEAASLYVHVQEHDVYTDEDWTVTRSSGTNLLTYGIYVSASGGQTNYALYTDKGAVQVNGNTTLGDDSADVTTIHGHLIVNGRDLSNGCK